MDRRVGFLLLTAGWGANHFAALLVLYRAELHFSAASLGVLFGAYALGLVPGLIFAGRASDRHGRRALVLPASVVAVVASAILAFGSFGFGVLLVGRLLFGLAMGSIMSPGSVWVAELSPPGSGPRRATLALSAGFGVGPFASGVIAQFAPAPMVIPYVAHGAVMLVAVLLAAAVPETATLKTPNAGERARGLGTREITTLARQLPVAPWAFGLAAIAIAILPGIMRPLVSKPILYSSFVILTTLVAGVLVQPLTGRLGRRADLIGLGLGALGIFLASYAVAIGSPVLAYGVAILLGLGYGLVMTIGLREVSESASPETRGTAVGIYYVLTYVGFALPFVHAVAAKTSGDAATFRLTAWVVVACLGARGFLGRPRGA